MTKATRRKPSIAPAASALIAGVLLTGPAFATVENVYNASMCVGASAFDQANLQYNVTQSGDIVSTANGTRVVCPIPKTTSGPGITNDRLLSVDVFHVAGKTVPSRCAVTVYFSGMSSINDYNTAARKESFAAPGAIGYSITPTPAITEYWWDDTSWFYTELDCTLDSGQSFALYTVDESGTAQTARIFPASTCLQQSGSAHANFAISTGPGGGAAGFAESPGGGAIDYGCLVPNSVAQFALLRSGNSAGFGISSSNPPTTMQPGSFLGGVGVPAFPTVIYPSTTLPAISPMTASGNWLLTPFWNVFIKQLATVGDMAIVSFRTN